MPRLLRSCRLFWIAPALALAALPAAAQNQHDMTFHTVPPCTVVDTRNAGGAFAAGEIRTYNIAGSGSLASQGGSATGCGVPGFSNGIAQVQAVALNVVAFAPTGPGNIVANAADQALAGSVVNFTANQNTSNTTPVAVAQVTGVGDFRIQVNISSAHVVIRVFGYYSKPVQTVHVHPVPGDHTASGTALLNALAGITNASATKRYVIKLEPGIYDVGSTELVMKPYVDIEGSGQQATVIQGVGNNDEVPQQTAVVQGATFSELRDLQVKSTSSPSLPFSIAILITDGADMRIVDVTAVSSGSGYNWAIRNRSSSAVVERSTLRTEGGTLSYGISSTGVNAVTTVRHSVIEVTNATSQSYGLGASSGGIFKELRDVQIKVSAAGGSLAAYGYRQDYNPYSSSPVRITSSTIDVTGASTNKGILFDESLLHVDHSEITGETSTVDGNNVYIGATRLNGGPVGAGVTCAGVYDETFTFFAGPDCP